MPLTSYEALCVERALCRRGLVEYTERAWRVLEPDQPLVMGWHIEKMAEHLEAVTAGQINRLLINVPPGCMKSLMTAVLWPSWEWGPMGTPGIRFIGASHESTLATRDNRNMRRLVMSEWYQSLWPVEITGDQNEKTFFENKSGGWRQSCPVRSMTGRRGDRVLWDDPLSTEDAYSAAKLAEAERVFRETLPTRVNDPANSAIVVIMQRLADRDTSGIILSEDFGYEHLMLPMEFEPARRCVTVLGVADERAEDGALLFPERFSRKVVDRDKKLMGAHAVAGQFQQRPSPLGGNLIKGEWFGRYQVVPKLEYRVIYADTAQKTKERNDYSVFGVYGKGADGKVYVLDIVRGKWEAPELQRRAVDVWRKHKALDDPKIYGTLRRMSIEDKASGTGLIQQIKRDAFCPVVAMQRNTDKLMRLMDVAGQMESGYVMLPDTAPWTSDFVGECEAFSADDSHAHDDQVDTLIDAVKDMLGGGGYDIGALI